MVNDHPRNLSCRAVLTFDSPWAPILGNTGSKNAAGTSWHYYYEQEATSNEGITTSSKNATRCTHNILRPKSRGGHTPSLLVLPTVEISPRHIEGSFAHVDQKLRGYFQEHAEKVWSTNAERRKKTKHRAKWLEEDVLSMWTGAALPPVGLG